MTMIQLIACIGMIAGLFMVLHVSPRELSDSLFSRLTAAPGSIRADINETTMRKKAGFLRREITEAQAVLAASGRADRFPMVCFTSLLCFALGACIAIAAGNAFLVPVLAVGLMLTPFWYVKLTAGSFKKDVAAELETALSVITTAYLRTENFQQAVEENVRYLHPPVQEVFQRFLAGSFRTQIAESISAGGVVDLTGIADKYAGFLPESFRASIVETCERSISAVLSDNAVVLADAIVQKVLAPLLTPVISVVLFFVAFALLRMLVSMLVTVLGLVNRLPVIGTVNRWLGWLTGCIASTMDIYLVLCVVWAIIVITGGNLTVLNDTVMSSSLYYKAFNLFNPFL